MQYRYYVADRINMFVCGANTITLKDIIDEMDNPEPPVDAVAIKNDIRDSFNKSIGCE